MKNLKILFIINALCFLTISICAQEMSLEEEIEYVEKINAQKRAIVAQQDIIKNLEVRIATLEKGKEKEEGESTPDLISTGIDISRYETMIANLQNSIQTLRGEISSYQSQISDLSTKISAVESKNTHLTNDLKELNDDFIRLEAETKILRSTVACLDEFAQERKTKASEARTQIEAANKLIDFRKKQVYLSESDKMQRTQQAFMTYIQYGGGADSVICNGKEFFYDDDYLNGVEHLDLLEIVAKNEYNVIELLGNNTGKQIRNSNSMMLENLAAVYKKGNYDEQSDAAKISEKIGFYLEGERKGNAGMDASETLSKIKSIKTAFDAGNFTGALTTYNKYERYFELKDIASEVNTVAEAHYAASVILLWNLGGVVDHKELFIKDTWLARTTANSPVGYCRLILTEKVIKNKDLDNKNLKKKAAHALAKVYYLEDG